MLDLGRQRGEFGGVSLQNVVRETRDPFFGRTAPENRAVFPFAAEQFADHFADSLRPPLFADRHLCGKGVVPGVSREQ